MAEFLPLSSAFHRRSPVHQPWYRVLYFGYVPRVRPASDRQTLPLIAASLLADTTYA